MKMIKNFLKDESGMETLEYAVIAGLIAAVAVFVYVGTGAGGWGQALKDRLLGSTSTG
jgi:Flp pilus assembly pilin Flp